MSNHNNTKINIPILERPEDIKSYWFVQKKVILLIIFFGIIYNIFSVLSPIFQGQLIDSIVNNDNLYSIIKNVGYFLLIILLIQLTRLFKRFYVRRFANTTIAAMRMQLYDNIINKNINDLSNENTGNLMTRLISDVDLCVEGMRKVTTEVFDTGVLMVGYLVFMLIYSVKITILSCIFIGIAMLIAEKVKVFVYKTSSAYRKKTSELNDLLYNTIDNTLVFRACGVEKIHREQCIICIDEYANKAIKADILTDSLQPIYNLISFLGIVIVVYFGGTKVINNTWSIGTFSTYLIMFTAFSKKASKASKLFNAAQKSKISWLRIKPYIKKHTNYANNYLSKKDVTLLDNTVLEVSNLQFSYGEYNKRKIINNVGFSLQSGEILGVTGPIACGKSSLGIALLGLYPYDGSIKINDKELRDYSPEEISSIVSYTSHNPQLISDTIYNNITLGERLNTECIMKDIDFVKDMKSMKDGENTFVGNGGVSLSGGQQARLSLGRALIKKCKIIILDDPFASVDAITSRNIMKNLKENYSDSIIILISHNISLFNFVDKVLLINETSRDKETSFELGTHKELLNSSKLYSTIYNLQGGEENDK